MGSSWSEAFPVSKVLLCHFLVRLSGSFYHKIDKMTQQSENTYFKGRIFNLFCGLILAGLGLVIKFAEYPDLDRLGIPLNRDLWAVFFVAGFCLFVFALFFRSTPDPFENRWPVCAGCLKRFAGHAASDLLCPKCAARLEAEKINQVRFLGYSRPDQILKNIRRQSISPVSTFFASKKSMLVVVPVFLFVVYLFVYFNSRP